jgi:DUF1680 family protein
MRRMLPVAICSLMIGFGTPSTAAQTGLGGVRRPVVEAKVADRFAPAPYDRQRVDGLLGARMRANLDARLLRVDEPRLLAGFRHRPGEQEWIGEHAGKFLDAAANTWAYTRDERLKTLMDRLARELVATQQADGYLGTYVDGQRWTSWDVWVHKYDLIGMLAYHRVTGSELALDSAKRVADLLCRTFGEAEGQRDIVRAGEHVGMAATSVLEPMCTLYRYTGERRYLDFCYYLTRAYDQSHGPKVIRTLAETGRVDKTANGKAYEMLSNLVGLLELYRITGDATFLAPALAAWKDITAHRLYITGTASSREHFQDDFVLPADKKASMGEGCVTVTWVQLNWHLLRLTGEPQYAEEIERSVYNHLLGAQDPANGNICYYTPLNGTKSYTPGINCCVSSEPRGISMIPQLAWGTRDRGVAVLLYTQGQASISAGGLDVELRSQTRFPADGAVKLTVAPPRTARFPLYLRVPAWTSRYTASVGGAKLRGKPGEFLTIDRVWKPGDTVTIDMDMTVRLLPGGKSYPNSVAVRRGPQVLALDAAANPNQDLRFVALDGPTRLGHVTDADAFTAEAVVANLDGSRTRKHVVLVPFADARNYRVWLARADALDAEVEAARRVITAPRAAATSPRARSAPAMDGRLDEALWSLTNSVAKSVIGAPNNRARFGTLWDEEYLYVGVEILDADLRTDGVQPWESDSIEIYLDADHNRGEEYDTQDRQFVLVWNGKEVRASGDSAPSLLFAWAPREGGYTVEVGIPWKRLGIAPKAGLVLGFDLGNNDNDGNGRRDHKLIWATSADEAWRDTSEFGDLTLRD